MSTRKKIVLVEDNLDDVRLTKLALENLAIPADMVHCGNGEQLLNLLQTEPLSNISYILLDLNMPRMSGIEFLTKIKADEKLKYLPIIILTTSENRVDLLKCFEIGIAGYIIKPLKYEDYESKLRKVFDYWEISELIKG